MLFLEPDLTSGDGIYSRYVTQYPATGKYTYKVNENTQFCYFFFIGRTTIEGVRPPRFFSSSKEIMDELKKKRNKYEYM